MSQNAKPTAKPNATPNADTDADRVDAERRLTTSARSLSTAPRAATLVIRRDIDPETRRAAYQAPLADALAAAAAGTVVGAGQMFEEVGDADGAEPFAHAYHVVDMALTRPDAALAAIVSVVEAARAAQGDDGVSLEIASDDGGPGERIALSPRC